MVWLLYNVMTGFFAKYILDAFQGKLLDPWHIDTIMSDIFCVCRYPFITVEIAVFTDSRLETFLDFNFYGAN